MHSHLFKTLRREQFFLVGVMVTSEIEYAMLALDRFSVLRRVSILGYQPTAAAVYLNALNV